MRDHDPDENSYNRMNDAILEIASRYEDAGEPARAYALRGLVDGWSTHRHRQDVPPEHADYYKDANALGYRVDFDGFPVPPAPERIRCPHCGIDDLQRIQWQEWLPSTREIAFFADGMIWVDASDYKDHGEGACDDELWCTACGESFPIPKGVGTTHVEPDEIEARLAAGPVTQTGTFEPEPTGEGEASAG